jgi:hypothetical protein
VAQVGDRRLAEHALAALDEELVASELDESDANMSQMFRPSLAVYENVIKKTRMNRRKKGRRTSFISAWNVTGALHSPNGMTRNS